MPSAALRPCLEPRCPQLVAAGRCATHAQAKERTRELWEARKWYRTIRWANLRAYVLTRQPFCPVCERDDHRVVRATVVDHATPHRGDPALFWDVSNLIGLCKRHHDAKTQRGE